MNQILAKEDTTAVIQYFKTIPVNCEIHFYILFTNDRSSIQNGFRWQETEQQYQIQISHFVSSGLEDVSLVEHGEFVLPCSTN